MIIDGKRIAREIIDELALSVRARGLSPRLGIVVTGNNPVIESFVRIKAKTAATIGIDMERINLAENVPQADIVGAVEKLSRYTDGIIVQLPLPKHVDTDAVLASIPPEKDVDGINPSGSAFIPPVAIAIEEILKRSKVNVVEKRAVVVGAGRLVGAPAAKLLEALGAHVSVLTHESASLAALKDADIIVSGAGEPEMITPDLIGDGVVLIDAGTSESGGRVRGDADPSCADKCSVFTPVPGGVGPIAVAMIFRNLLQN